MKLSFILITFILLFSSTSAIQTTGMGAEGVNEVKSKIQTIEDKMNEVEALERQLLMSVDSDMNEDSEKLGTSSVHRSKSALKIKSEIEHLQKIRVLLPQLHGRMKAIIKTLPKKEQLRLIRNMNLRHRFSLGTWEETA